MFHTTTVSNLVNSSRRHCRHTSTDTPAALPPQRKQTQPMAELRESHSPLHTDHKTATKSSDDGVTDVELTDPSRPSAAAAAAGKEEGDKKRESHW